MKTYADFLATKTRDAERAGIDIDLSDIHPKLHEWQKEIVKWATGVGRAAIWADTGLGKTFMQVEWARPIWLGIRETNTLNTRAAKENNDEKHIAPLQLDFIERCVRLWSNPGELVLSPFMGIGSEGYVSVKLGRRFIGCELKPSYWAQAVRNLEDIEREVHAPQLFEVSS